MLRFYRSFFVSPLFYVVMIAILFLMVTGYFSDAILMIATIALGTAVLLVLIDILLLYQRKANITGSREMRERFSNGDDNAVTLTLMNQCNFALRARVIDEVPVQFQMRDFDRQLKLKSAEQIKLTYHLRPVERGEYHFGHTQVLIQSPIGLIYKREQPVDIATVKVYPSFLQMRQFEMMAISNRLTEMGIKKIRRIGHQMEFDQIRDYTTGDDYRTINWKATARKSHLMVNQYQDEKSQQVYSLVDMGRSMKMPFNGMTLLDYAINTSLVISDIAMVKHDKAGLITFNDKIRSVVQARRSEQHLQTIMESLYNQQTTFGEHNLHAMYAAVRRHIHQRSLLILFTNFESLQSAQRQIPFLLKLAKDHLLVVIFFENTEIKSVTHQTTETVEDIYIKTIAEKFIYDKKLIAKELQHYGIHPVLTEPGQLTVNAINKYLELKARGLI
jgi:uncharacterized protein (DUF58 family)